MKLYSSVTKFAQDMQRKLNENSHKGGWRNHDLFSLFARLEEEAEELQEALMASDGIVDPKLVIRECADVANFAMMIAANVREGIE